MMRGLRKLYYLLRAPRVSRELIGRVVHRGALINGSWIYNQGEGVITGSEVVNGRRCYRIQFDHHVAVLPLPHPEFEISTRRGLAQARTDLPETYWTPMGWYQPGSSYSAAMRLIPGSPRWWRWRVWRAIKAAYYRRWPPPEVYVGRRVRATRLVVRRIPPGTVGMVTSSTMAGDRRRYRVEFADRDDFVETLLPSPKFELVD